MLTFPDYNASAANFIQGPARAYYAPYVAAGGDAPSNTIVPIGFFSDDGIEFDHKLTFGDVHTEQSTYPVDTFLIGQELDVKVTWQDMSPGGLNVGLGLNPASLDGTPPATQIIGDFFDPQLASGIPSTRPPMRQWIFQIPSPGHDSGTTPIAAYAYVQLFKACVIAHGPVKVGIKHLGSMQTTIRAFMDFSITTAAGRVGKWVMP